METTIDPSVTAEVRSNSPQAESSLAETKMATAMSRTRTSMSHLRTHLSNERTHLSYMRTAIALISFGISINRFSITLRESGLNPMRRGAFVLRDTENVGLGMVIVGVIVLVGSMGHFLRINKQIEDDTFVAHKWPLVNLTLGVIALGAASVIWLILH